MSGSTWTPAEDAALELAVASHNGRNWKLIAESVPNKTDTQCMHRWSLTLKPGIVKGLWTHQVLYRSPLGAATVSRLRCDWLPGGRKDP
jgi:hypothetical protein